ncbi:MAG: glycoside hydrolase/phage tail family protein [Hyphomonadaceae bacterium]|nr:glycoside hydrolase/phage tail family protein [Hyphomonadaceae bacterium]
MAELVLSTIGRTVGAALPGALGRIGAAVLSAGGAALGRSIDQRLFGTTAAYEGPRFTDLHMQASSEGASIPALFGSTRLAGQVIWTARFKEKKKTQDVGGGKGGPRATTTTYTYSLSFAVGLCEGEITRLGRVWANGQALDLSTVNWRLHTGGETQAPDPLIEAIEGAANAPAYRGLAYVVFEDLPLEEFGNTIPQLSFEVIRAAPPATPGPRFEDRVKALCVIPGAGEFVYETAPIFRLLGPGRETPENVQSERNRANLLVSLDQLKADFPSCDTIVLVASWFGDDLRCGSCAIKPGVEVAAKETKPVLWRAGGVARGGARLISQHDGAPAFGGTPSDRSVKNAIAELKARGFKVWLYPFLLMDVPATNALPDPYGGIAQAAYPWRGRISLHPAAGRPGTPDKTSAAAAQVTAFFGAAAPAHFGASDGVPTYAGPSEWSYRRFILHYAKLASLAGGVDAFIVGSELRALTTARDGASSYPAVSALKTLAADVRAMLGAATKLTYAADWSEYGGHQPQDGTGDVHFHLDPLWSDANIDAVGIDWYPPLSDWRDGAGHLDAGLARDIYEPVYLRGRIEAGENYDWYYASAAHRASQTRVAITDGAHNEPWIYRAKDVRNFWARQHFNRPGGVRAATPTAWVPQSKPVWFVELGCPAVDKGANAPNLFNDGKSSESALPPFSSGARDDLIQRRTLDAYLTYWSGAANPISTLTAKPMIEHIALWAWDARPFPAFPAQRSIWADGGAWRLGHWLNGRAGLSELSDVVTALCVRGGVRQVDASSLRGAVSGVIVDSPASVRAALEPLMAAYDFTAAERAGVIHFEHGAPQAALTLASTDFAERTAGERYAERSDAAEWPIEARVRFIDAARDYLIASVSARRRDRAEGGVVTIDAPLVLEANAAEAIAERALGAARAEAETLQIELGPGHLALEPGDVIALAGVADTFEIVRIEDMETRRVALRRVRMTARSSASLAEPSAPALPTPAPTPAVSLLDLPPLPNAEDDDRPLAAVSATPWRGAHALYCGWPGGERTSVTDAATMGELTWALWPGSVDRWDEGNRFRIRLYGGAPSSASEVAVLNGANVFAIESSAGEWEIVQARNCTLVAPNEYELSGLLRGRLGSAHAMRVPHPAGARIVQLEATLARVNIAPHEWGEALSFVAPPAGAPPEDSRAHTFTVTLKRVALRPWAPAHLRARRGANGDIDVSWVRCARIGGDAWGAAEPPLGASTEAYKLVVLNGAAPVRTVIVSAPAYLYSVVEQTADFGVIPSSLRFRVMQIGDGGAEGLNTESAFTL